VGGSTTVNWTSSFRTPKATLAFWREHFGLTEMTDQKPWRPGSGRPSSA
jgi:hypothetical protein